MNKNKKIALGKKASKYITTHIADLWPGFTAIPFILYDDENQIAFGGDKWPNRYAQEQDGVWVAEGPDPQLFANTVTMYHDVITAIWDTRTWSDDPNISEVAGGIAHEMFHAHQHTFKAPGADEVLYTQYPHSGLSVALVIEESKLLLEIIANPDAITVRDCLEKILVLRKQREAEIGADYIGYDKGCESYEGTAAYVEIHMKALIEKKTPFEVADSYLALLNCNDSFLNHYRARCYASGLVLCLASDVIWGNWQLEWVESGKTVFDWMSSKLSVAESEIIVTPTDLQTADELLTAYKSAKEQKVNDFMAQPLTLFEGSVKLAFLDPMNLVCVDDRCLHKHGGLIFGTNKQTLSTPFLTISGTSVFDAKQVYVPNINLKVDGSRIIVDGLGEMYGYVETTPNGMRCVITENVQEKQA